MSAGVVVAGILCAALAAANGANDVSKGVATLAGAGVTRYRTAVAWGVVATLAGALLSLTIASGLSRLFTKGIVAAPPSVALALAVLSGATAWVLLATLLRLPVSTTHAIVGSLVGAGLVLHADLVRWRALLLSVATPLLLSVVIAYVLSAVLSHLVRRTPSCICMELEQRRTLLAEAGTGSVAAAMSLGPSSGTRLSRVRLRVGSRTSCAVHAPSTRPLYRIFPGMDAAHWVTAGATSMARGLNDTPKIWALGAIALVPTHLSERVLLAVVALAMAFGGAVAGIRVARRLGEDVVHMEHREGFAANLSTALLVCAGARLGLPMSTTHCATGAIAGTARGHAERLNGKTLRDFAVAWTLTPALAGVVAATVALLLR